MKSYVRKLFAWILVTLILAESCEPCSPGRGGHRRRILRKLTPLVYKQHVPNVSENTIRASGLSEGKIPRDSPRFKDLVPNYNPDIIFKDEEGTGEDRFMTQRCKEKLNTLAISVMNQWPGVKLRVTEGWGNDKHHAIKSLHYEGRAVDITTSDRDRSKYGMLARLAVEAGFDWVYYESRAHIHCSVKSESSNAAKSGGCFPSSSTVMTKEGRISMDELRVGDEVLVVNDDKKVEFSEVIMFLDRDTKAQRLYYTIQTEFGTSITLTPSHMIYSVKKNDTSSKLTPTFAANVEEGDFVYVVENSNNIEDDELRKSVVLQKVVGVEAKLSTGVFAPLTVQGTIVVDETLASCYAVINSQKIAHWAFAPVRIYTNVKEFFRDILIKIKIISPETQRTANTNEQGIPWYPRTLYSIANYILPSSLLYN